MTLDHALPPTAADAPSPPSRRARWFGWWFYVTVMVVAPFALLLAAALGVWLWWKWDEMQAARDVKAEVARIQSLGEPVTIYDLYTWHRVPEGTNDTTALWLAALAAVDAIPIRNTKYVDVPIVAASSRKADSLAKNHPQSTLALAEDFLKTNDAAIQATLAAASASGQCRLPTAFNAGVAALVSTQRTRGVARLMSLRMRVAVERDNSPVAVESVQATLALASAIDHEPTIVNHLVRVAIIGVALSDIELLLSEGQLDDAQLAALETSVKKLDIQDGFTTGILGERGIGFHSFHQFATPPAARVATAAQPMAGGKLWRPADCRFYLIMMQDYIDASRQPFPKSRQGYKQIGARVATVAQSSNPLERMRSVLSMQVVPGMEAAFTASARTEALRQLTLTAIAAKRYQIQHGELPSELQSLNELLKELPTDPFDGQPLRLIRRDDALVIYSVGQDGRDNGGTEIQDRYDPDIVVQLK